VYTYPWVEYAAVPLWRQSGAGRIYCGGWGLPVGCNRLEAPESRASRDGRDADGPSEANRTQMSVPGRIGRAPQLANAQRKAATSGRWFDGC
jgi:hypothetical protein